MNLESLFQHIVFSEHQAEEGRRRMREGGRVGRLPGGLSSSRCGAWGGRKSRRQRSEQLRAPAFHVEGKAAERRLITACSMGT